MRVLLVLLIALSACAHVEKTASGENFSDGSNALVNAAASAGTHWEKRVSSTRNASEPCLYAKARYLEPETGRFLSEDPFRGDIGDPFSTQGFVYGRGNPTRFLDPTGRFDVEVACLQSDRGFSKCAARELLILADGGNQDAGRLLDVAARIAERGKDPFRFFLESGDLRTTSGLGKGAAARTAALDAVSQGNESAFNQAVGLRQGGTATVMREDVAPVVEAVAGFHPAVALTEASTGQGAVTGKSKGVFDRVLAGAGALIGPLKALGAVGLGVAGASKLKKVKSLSQGSEFLDDVPIQTLTKTEVSGLTAGRRAQIVGALNERIRKLSGFGDDGVPVILDNNLSPRAAETLRGRGFNVRSVREIFGNDPGDDVITDVAQRLGARVLTKNVRDFPPAIRVGVPRQGKETNVDLFEQLLANEGLRISR